MPRTIAEPYRAVVALFVQQARTHYPDEIEDVIVYGSVARGDARTDSDIDVAVIVRRGDPVRIQLHLARLAFETLLRTGFYISVNVLTPPELRAPTFYAAALREEGIHAA